MKNSLFGFILVSLATAPNAQELPSPELHNRLIAFQNAQNVCKGIFLLNSDAASSFVGATKSSLSEICECAALLTVANTSKDDISALANGDQDVSIKMASEVRERTLQCVKIN
jgi:hypothetical protein